MFEVSAVSNFDPSQYEVTGPSQPAQPAQPAQGVKSAVVYGGTPMSTDKEMLKDIRVHDGQREMITSEYRRNYRYYAIILFHNIHNIWHGIILVIVLLMFFMSLLAI